MVPAVCSCLPTASDHKVYAMGYRGSSLALIFLLAAVLCTGGVAVALAGSLSVAVTDADSGEPLIGVDAVLVGLGRKGTTDLEGKVSFTGLAAGSYRLRLTYLGYNTRLLPDIPVPADGDKHIEVALESFQAYAADDMVVSASRILSTESALLASRKAAGVVGDAISAAQISRTPDGTSGDALKRVPGLTVRGGKYVFVRGVTDRYNVTEINGVSMTGTNIDQDRKSFNFDMVPSSLLANVSVIKTATPDMPGDFSGGLVRINTLEFPDQATTAVGFGAGRTDGTTGKPYLEETDPGPREWLGLDDGHRAFPVGLAGNDLARALPNRWGIREGPAPVKYSWHAAHGGSSSLLGGNLGYMAAVTYRNDYDREDGNESRKADPTYGGQTKTGAFSSSHTQVLWGGLANMFYRFNGNHRIGLNNFYTRSADNIITTLQGEDSDKLFRWRSLD